ncbi:MAG: class I mannose-6-phosphate isomerase [Oscillospiraceae bacterium]|nr:class I mannose-6-phosphate isomerase [Oscillospiraceae bacterium]
MNLYPMKLKPVLKEIIWGGSRLASDYGKSSDKTQKIAESWELAVHENGTSIIENGEHAGKSLGELFEADKSIVAPDYNSDKFPLLVKFIDAEKNLSVQVHPDDAYAARQKGESGKTEMWYVMEAKPGAKMVFGLNGDYTREQLQRLVDENKFEQCLNYEDAKPGDVFFVPAGLVHAIGEGILLAEIQQNSDTTYRLYDYNRIGADGKARELHIKKALDACIKTKAKTQAKKAGSEKKHEILADCEYFCVERFFGTDCKLEPICMKAVVCTKGEGEIAHKDKIYAINKGESYFLPAGLSKCEIKPQNGDFTYLCVGIYN